MTRALLIMGPTASGKSALALAVAERLGGEIVNADSMQVYRDLRVLTARPSPEEEACAPHHLYGTIDAAERFSTGRWLEAAVRIIEDIQKRGRMPIVIGGLKVSATLSVIGAVVGEFVSANAGLGYLINFGRGTYDTPLVIAAVFTLTLLALTLYGLASWLESILLDWQTTS